MPRYFFHLECDDYTVLDPSGAEMRDSDDAWAAAKVAARNLMQTQTDAAVNWLNGTFFVADEAGEIVLEMPFSEVVEEDAKQRPN